MKKNLFNQYLGDGDTSSFKEVLNSDSYKDYDIKPEKLECVGHTQKRTGTQLRNLVDSKKGTDAPLHGRNKLTLSVINSMQNFYGLAIRNNTENLYAMKKAVSAILFHCTNFTYPTFRHRFCPKTESSWCKWQVDQLKGTHGYKNSISLPLWIHNLLKPIFIDLSSENLLKKCLHGQTQNTNECLNSIVWSRYPKNIFVSRTTFEMGINSAVLHFNDGTNGVKEVLHSFGLYGCITSKASRIHNLKRVREMEKKSTDKVKKRRKTLRTIKKGYLDKESTKEKEPSYHELLYKPYL